MRICATLITGNASDLIVDAIQSALPLVDMLLLIDTGITDDTLSKANETAGDRLHVSQFTWCNHFAAVRNYALYQSAKLGADIAATIDSDERFACDHQSVREQLETDYESHPSRYLWMMESACGTYSKERFFRLPVPQRMHWKGQTHECFVGYNTTEFGKIQRGQFTEVPKTHEQVQLKYQRDLAILQETCRTDGDDARWWFYLGQTHRGLGNTVEAIDAYRKAMTIRSNNRAQLASAGYCAATIAFGNKDYETALDLCCLGLACDSNWPELHWFAGLCCYHLKRYRDAIAWCETSIALGHVTGIRAGEDRVIFRYLPGWFETPFEVLRFVFNAIGDEANAAEMEKKYVDAKSERERRYGKQ